MANPTIKIAVSQADATLVQTTTLTAGMRVTPTVKFSFADEWSGLGKTAVCRAGAVCLEVLIVNNQITVPIECLETAGVNLIIGVYGTDTTIAIPTVWCACGEILSGTNVEEPSNVGEATPTLVDQMLAYAADIEALAEDIDENVIRNVAVNTEGANAYGITTVTLADTGAGENRTLTFYFSNLKGNGIESITWSSVPPYRGRIQITQSNGTVTNFDALIDAINFLESLTNLSEAYAKGTIGGVDVEEGEPGYQDNAKYYAEMAADAEDGAEAAQADAEEAQSYAEAAQDAAEAAQTAAETAQGLAEAAQTAAETAASNAILSSESAAADAVTAGNHAAAAEASSVQAGSYSDAASTSAGNSANSASSSAEQALKSEGYAVGAQNGTEVSSGSTYYHNNAKYYSEKAYDDAQATAADRAVVEGAMDAIEDARDDAISDIQTQQATSIAAVQTEGQAQTANAAAEALKAEGYATGKQNGTDVSSGTYYHDNAKYYKEQAAISFSAAYNAQTAAETAQGLAETAQAAAEAAQEAAEEAAATFETDTTLSVAGKAADAEATGDAIADLDETKADIDGYYESMTVGNAEQLVATVGVEDNAPYNFRTTGGNADVGDRKTMEIVGGTIAWNQLVKNGNFSDTSVWVLSNASFTVAGSVATVTKTQNSSANFYQSISKIVGHKYFCSYTIWADTEFDFTLNWGNVIGSSVHVNSQITTHEYIFTGESAANENLNFYFGTGSSSLAQGKSVNLKNVVLFDLTQMFGSSIADYVYSLGHDGAAAWFRHLFPKPYYAYNAGELMSVNTSAHITRSFNAWDGESESGRINTSTGETTSVTPGQRTKNFVPVLPATTYYILSPSNEYVYIIEYDADKSYIRYASYYKNARYTTGSKAHYIKFYSVVNTGLNGVCINLSWDGERDGEYEAYQEWVYPLDESLTLRGIPKLDASNKLYYDGDTYESDGTVTRKYKVIDLGSLSWTYQSSVPYFQASIYSPDTAKPDGDSGYDLCNAICDKYINATWRTLYYNTAAPKTIAIHFNGNSICVYDPDYTDANTFKTAVSGVMFAYELNVATTEEAEPYTNPQIVDDFGTEEYLDYAYSQSLRDVAIPVGHETQYMANLRAKLEMAPDSPDGDGDYIVRQTNGTNEYVPLVIPQELPDLPSDNGTYKLQVVVSGNTKTLSWVSA